MLPGPPRRRRARPVADAPIEALLSRSEDLAKGWLLALLERAPLDDAPRILAADLSREGPRLCETVVRAIANDTDQARLEPGGELFPLAARAGELAGASGAEATSHAVDALQAVVWVALRSDLHDPEPDLVSDLAQRLAQVTELVRAAALRRADEGAAAGVRGAAAGMRAREPTEGPRHAGEPEGLSFAARSASEPDVVPPPPVAGRRPAARSWIEEQRPDARPWIQEQRAAEALWVRGLEEEIQRTGRSPLSLLLAELEDADRVRAIEADPARILGEFTRAVRRAVRRQDILVCDTETRAWIIATDTERSGARALGERISASVVHGQPWRGAPMRVGIGVAVLGEDGRTAAELIDAAEETRFAASASGVDLVGTGPTQPPPEH